MADSQKFPNWKWLNPGLENFQPEESRREVNNKSEEKSEVNNKTKSNKNQTTSNVLLNSVLVNLISITI